MHPVVEVMLAVLGVGMALALWTVALNLYVRRKHRRLTRERVWPTREQFIAYFSAKGCAPATVERIHDWIRYSWASNVPIPILPEDDITDVYHLDVDEVMEDFLDMFGCPMPDEALIDEIVPIATTEDMVIAIHKICNQQPARPVDR